jgi:hypothetical protein
MALWSAAILAALGLAWLAGTVVTQLFQTRDEIRRCVWSCRDAVEFRGPSTQKFAERTQLEAIEHLGGARNAVRRLRIFRHAPDWFTERGTQPDDLGNKDWAILLLGHCGQPGAAELVPLLRDRQKRTQLLALMAAEHLGPQGAEAVPFVEPLLADEDSWLRGAAADALKAIRGGEPAKP